MAPMPAGGAPREPWSAVEPGRVVLIDADTGAVPTYRELSERADEVRSEVGCRGLAFLFADMTVRSVADFLALRAAGHAVALVDAALAPDLAAGLLERYRPDIVVASPDAEVSADYRPRLPGIWRRDDAGPALHPELEILLTTSGSTGSPKFVRLSRPNIEANTRAIVTSLGLRAGDRAITTLPLFYSYGMSVVNTHVAVGGAVVVHRASVIEPRFWDAVRQHQVTFLNGVPTTFAMLKRVGLDQRGVPSVRALTQAGGRMSDELIEHFADLMQARGGELFVMYGQTEAGPRIACRAVTQSRDRIGSVGQALEGGQLAATGPSGEPLPTGEIGEIVYTGPNVMLGYAAEPADLALGDVQGGSLATGDLGQVDEDGFLFLRGRTKRIAKIAGMRISLDELEAHAHGPGPVAAVSAGDEGAVVFCEWPADADFVGSQRELGRHLKLPPRSVCLRHIEALPKLPNGKVDYQTLQRTLEPS